MRGESTAEHQSTGSKVGVNLDTLQGKSLLCLGALLVTLLVVVPALFIEPVSSHVDIGEATDLDAFRIVHVPNNVQESDQAADNLYAWVKLRDPFALLGNVYGFGGFVEPYCSRHYYSAVDFALQVEELDPWKASEAVVANWEDRTLTNGWATVIDVELPPAPPLENAQGIIWLGENGQRILNPPVVDEAGALQCVNSNSVSGDTELQVVPNCPDKLPRILVMASCGNSDLDRMAVDALRKTFRELQDKAYFDSDAPKVAAMRLRVIWKLTARNSTL